MTHGDRYVEALNKAFAFYTDGRHQLPDGVYFNGIVEEGIRVALLEIFPELGERIRQWRAEKEAVTTPVTKAVTTPLQ